MAAPPTALATAEDRVLLVRITALGDVMLVAPVARAIAAAAPGVAVDLLTDARIAPLMQGTGAFSRVIGWDRRGVDAGLGGVLRVRARLLAGGAGYRAVIDLQGKLRTRALAALLPAAARATLRKRGWRGVIAALLGRDRPIVDRHTVDMYLEVAGCALGGRTLPAPAAPPVRREDRRGVDRLREDRPRVDGPRADRPRVIGLGVGTTHATKRWPHFAPLAQALAARWPGARMVLVGGPSDRAELDALRAAVSPELLDPRDSTALDPVGLMGLIGELDALVSVDSGAAHVGQALGVPTLVLFGPTSPRRWGPRGPGHAALSLGLPCSPCSNVGGPVCPRPARDHACLRDLEAARVAEALAALLEAP